MIMYFIHKELVNDLNQHKDTDRINKLLKQHVINTV